MANSTIDLQQDATTTIGSTGRCAMCNLQLPLRAPQTGEQPIDWECAGCGAVMRGVLREGCDPEIRFNVFPAQIGFQCDQLVHPYEDIAEFIGKMTTAPVVNQSKRQWPRTTLIAAASAIPLDEYRQAVGVSFMVMLHNISGGGVAFTHAQPISHPYVALELWAPGNERLRTVMELKRVRAVGHFYEIAGQFVTASD